MCDLVSVGASLTACVTSELVKSMTIIFMAGLGTSNVKTQHLNGLESMCVSK